MRLLVIDEIHLLGDERGPVLEVIVSRTNFIASHTDQKVRVVGLSTALANAKDLADWLNIDQVDAYIHRSNLLLFILLYLGWFVQFSPSCQASSAGGPH